MQTTRDEGTGEIERAERNARRFAELKRQIEAERRGSAEEQRRPSRAGVRGGSDLLVVRG